MNTNDNTTYFETIQKYVKKSDEKLSGVMIHITNRCNLACIHCYNNSGVNDGEVVEITHKEWLDFVKAALESGISHLEISGGEPLLEVELLKDILHLASGYKDVRIQINTNGILLTDEFLLLLNNVENEMILQLSIDGHNFEIIENLRNNKEIFNHVIDAIRMIKKYNRIKLILVHTIHNKNKKYVNHFLKWVTSLEPDIVVVGFMLPIGRGENENSDCFMSLDDRLDLYKELLKLKREGNYDFKLASPGGIFDLINYYRDSELWMVVDNNGDVRYSCRMPYFLGNMQINSFEDLYIKLKENAKKDILLKTMAKEIELYTEFGYQKKIFF